jgi:hypothetical protein
MKIFHAPVERNTVDPSRPVHRSKTAPVKIKKTVQKWCRNGAVLNNNSIEEKYPWRVHRQHPIGLSPDNRFQQRKSTWIRQVLQTAS